MRDRVKRRPLPMRMAVYRRCFGLCNRLFAFLGRRMIMLSSYKIISPLVGNYYTLPISYNVIIILLSFIIALCVYLLGYFSWLVHKQHSHWVQYHSLFQCTCMSQVTPLHILWLEQKQVEGWGHLLLVYEFAFRPYKITYLILNQLFSQKLGREEVFFIQ